MCRATIQKGFSPKVRAARTYCCSFCTSTCPRMSRVYMGMRTMMTASIVLSRPGPIAAVSASASTMDGKARIISVTAMTA